MLNTNFPRLLGDIGNPASFKTPPIYSRVSHATVSSVIDASEMSDRLLTSLVLAAKELAQAGVNVIGTSCGFLSSVQNTIQTELSIPFISSSLELIPILRMLYGESSNIGVLTFDADRLTPLLREKKDAHKLAIQGLRSDGELHHCISNDLGRIDERLARLDVMDMAQRCVDENSDIQAFILECTNLSPWKNQIKSEFDLPVFDLVDALEWVNNSYRG